MVIVFVNFGLWQLRRADQKANSNALVNLRLEESPLPFEKIKEEYSLSAQKEDQNSAAYRRAVVKGIYDVEQEVLIRNRSYNGQPGYHLLTPLKLSSGKALLIERGWIPTSLDSPPITAATPPNGEVELVGILLPAQSQPQGPVGAKDPPSNKLTKVFWIDIKRLQTQISYPLEPIYLRLISESHLQDSLPFEIPPPSTDNGPHLGYALQWFSFAIILLVVYTLLLRKTLLETKQLK